jgi:hypothetical protein
MNILRRPTLILSLIILLFVVPSHIVKAASLETLAPNTAIEVSSKPRMLKLPNGILAQTSSDVYVGTDSDEKNPSALTAMALRERLGLTPKGDTTFPIKTMIVYPRDADHSAIENLHHRIDTILPAWPAPVDTSTFNEGSGRAWLIRNHNIIYSITRFLLNGTTVGATLIYALDVPAPKALFMGLLSGSISGSLQYNIDAYRDWLEDDSFVQKLSAPLDSWDPSATSLFVKVYNEFLALAEQYAKFGFTELTFHSVARIAMNLLRIPGVGPGFYNNAATVLTTAGQATVAGTGVFGLFKDLEIQREYNDWSEDGREVFQNTTTFLLSAAGVGFSAIQLANPAASSVVSLGFFEMPIGFAAITVVGLGFYAHALFTYLTMGP